MAKRGNPKGVSWALPRVVVDADGWRVPPAGTRARLIYGMLKCGYRVSEVTRELGMSRVTVSTYRHRFVHWKRYLVGVELTRPASKPTLEDVVHRLQSDLGPAAIARRLGVSKKAVWAAKVRLRKKPVTATFKIGRTESPEGNV